MPLTPLQTLAKESLKTLTPKQLVIWKMQKEYTQQEIARRLGISQPAVYKHLQAAAKHIRAFGKKYRHAFNTMETLFTPQEIEQAENNWQTRSWRCKTPIRDSLKEYYD